MHMADALVEPAVAATMYVCSGGAAGFSVKKVRLESDPKKIPVMGVMGAFVFAAQMINFTIPGTGSSGHLCGGMMLTALLGPYAAFLTMIGVLLIQCLLFAVGGIFASGKAETEDSTGGQIYLYGETHAVEQILEEELRLWQEYYANGMRHLFVELPYYTAQYLNQCKQAEDDEILMQVYADWNGTASHSANGSRFFRQI